MLSNITIRNRHLILFFLVILAMVLQGFLADRSYQHIVELHDQAAFANKVEISTLQLRQYEKHYRLEKTPATIQAFDETYDNLMTDIQQAESQAAIQPLAAKLTTYRDAFQVYVRNLTFADSQLAKTALDAIALATDDITSALAVYHQTLDDSLAIQESNQLRNLILITGLIIVTVGIAIWIISKSINAPLAELADTIEHIATETDLSITYEVKGKDEIAAVGQSLNHLFDALHGMIKQFDSVAHQLRDSSLDLTNITQEVHESTRRQGQQVSEAADSIEQLSNAAREIANNADKASQNVHDAHTQLQAGANAGDQARQYMQSLNEDVSAAMAAIQKLEENSANIGTVLDAIQVVAEQTNLLALNAAIEAARAGEQGRGFAVVADEVRMLAQRTHDSTTQIRATIEELQQGTHLVVETVTRSSERAEESIQKVNESSMALNEIATKMSEITDMNEAVAERAKEQEETSGKINQNVHTMSEGAQSAVGRAERIAQASTEMTKQSGKLFDVIARFHLGHDVEVW